MQCGVRSGMWRSMLLSFAVQTLAVAAVVIISIFTVDQLGAISLPQPDAAAAASAKGDEDRRIEKRGSCGTVEPSRT